MKELIKEFKGTGEVSNFWFKQIAASNCAYLYEISDANGHLHYEPFLRIDRLESETLVHGVHLIRAAKVMYPKSSDFGISAWGFNDYVKAWSCYEKVNMDSRIKKTA